MRILLADDHNLVRECIAEILRSDNSANVELAASLQQAIDMVSANQGFDLIILDYQMPGMNGLEGLSEMLKIAWDVPVALLSGLASNDVANKALELGASGFIPKNLPTQSMVSAINFMLAGETYVPFDVLIKYNQTNAFLLSSKEIEVLHGICEGKSNKEIAYDLGLKEVTIKLRVKTLSRKIGARNRTHAAMIARDSALI